MMMRVITDKYLITCKEYYVNGIIPAISIQSHDEWYMELKKIAESIIHENGIDSFAGFLQEGQYLVQLWTAHLVIEDKDISEDLKKTCLLCIKDYTDNPLVPEVSRAENLWLNKYYPNF